MAVVIDASVAMAWCFEDEASEYAANVLAALRTEAGVVPGLFSLEVANSLLVGERQNRLSVARSSAFLSMVSDLWLETDPDTAELANGVTLGLARAHGLSVYDAAYVELALRRGLAIATLDRDVRRAAERCGVRVWEREPPAM